MITEPKADGSYTNYYVTTCSQKLSEPVEVKMIILEEVLERHGVNRL